MNRALLVLSGLLIGALVLPAQFGLGKIRQKIDDAQRKAAPVTDRVERAAGNYRDWSEEEEQEIGSASAAKMVAMFGLVDAPELTRYVNLVGQAVAQFAPRQAPYRFGVLDSDIVGAFALPGGYIFITRTALEGMHNEAELAGVLGHEIYHVSERHLELEVRGRNNSQWALEEARAKTAGDAEFLRKRTDALLKDLFDLRLSRDKEEAADEEGTSLAAKAGYRADGLLEFLRTMEAAQQRNQRAFGQLLSTHPPFAERVAYLQPVVDRLGTSGVTLEVRFANEVE